MGYLLVVDSVEEHRPKSYIPSDSLTWKWTIGLGKTIFLYKQGGFYFHVSESECKYTVILEIAQHEHLLGAPFCLPETWDTQKSREVVYMCCTSFILYKSLAVVHQTVSCV